MDITDSAHVHKPLLPPTGVVVGVDGDLHAYRVLGVIPVRWKQITLRGLFFSTFFVIIHEIFSAVCSAFSLSRLGLSCVTGWAFLGRPLPAKRTPSLRSASCVAWHRIQWFLLLYLCFGRWFYGIIKISWKSIRTIRNSKEQTIQVDPLQDFMKMGRRCEIMRHHSNYLNTDEDTFLKRRLLDELYMKEFLSGLQLLAT